MNVLEKENLTKYEVHLKIDNLNVEDMFNRNRTNELLDIFRFVDKLQGKKISDVLYWCWIKLSLFSLSLSLSLLTERGYGKMQ